MWMKEAALNRYTTTTTIILRGTASIVDLQLIVSCLIDAETENAGQK